ncbi:unnamed protein product [Pieris macdunnoughi]|uniref:Uncharacterized protein n=1 Tax=Pieris macdunnoughi TaxID=345717 RepID=A0A821UHH1_9NEOP|nr:unnamed protein product [Pieris macdunnoughi]
MRAGYEMDALFVEQTLIGRDEHNALAEARRAHNYSLRRPPPPDSDEDAAGTAPKRVCAQTTPPNININTQHNININTQHTMPLSQRDPRRRRLADAFMGMTPTTAPPRLPDDEEEYRVVQRYLGE